MPTQLGILKSLRDEGRIRHLGVTTTFPRQYEDLERIMREEPLDFIGIDYAIDNLAMEERIRDGLVQGIKLYPGYEDYAINDSSLQAVFQIAEKYDVPVMIHTGDTYAKRAKVRQAHPLLVDDVAVDFPEVKFILCHLGNPWFQDAAQVLYKNDNVYADISGLTLGDFHYEFKRYMLQRVKDLIMYMGDPGQQLLYGTDWPLAGMGTYLKFFDGLELSDEARDNIAWRTAARLFRIDTDRIPPRQVTT